MRINMRQMVRNMGVVHTFERVKSKHGTDGKAHETTKSFLAKAIVQPASQDDLKLLEEGQRFYPGILIYITEPLNVGDYINFRDKKWRVMNSQDWSDYGFHQCIAIQAGSTETGHSKGFTVT